MQHQQNRPPLPETVQGLVAEINRLRQHAIRDGALDQKTKELIALGIAVNLRSNNGTLYHVHNAMKVGATPAEVAETIGVALAMAGEAVALHGLEALRGLDDAPTGEHRPGVPYMQPD